MRGLEVGIIGAGRSGISAARLLKRLGANVFISDRAALRKPPVPGVRFEGGGHTNRLLDSDLIIRSPGVPGHLPILDKIRKKKIPILSELELASRIARAKRVIAITGTNGKTTTTALVGAIFNVASKGTVVAGNIGTPLSDVALSTTPHSTLVLEVSSYQLEDISSFHPTISAILNVTPDHLDHHGTMARYAAAKARIFENQTAKDVCVLNADDGWCRHLAKRSRARVMFFSRKKKLRRGVYLDGHDIIVRWPLRNKRLPLRSRLPGPHNVENILAAVGIAVAGGVPYATIRRVLATFKGVEHRLEIVRDLRGVRYVNDSKATNVDSTRVALESFPGPMVVIMGGEGKGAPYTPLKAFIKRRVRKILLIGQDAPVIERQLNGLASIERVQTMRRAVPRASAVAKKGDVVLLSPACASFDQYGNYEERGQDFKALVRKLK